MLNPYMKESNWRGPEDGAYYRINSIGLRGREIRKKGAGVTRILLIGDSYVFGWKIRDEDRISSVMNTYLVDRLSTEKIEVPTVALPGWNVLSEKAFLENHLDLLQPDIVIWKPLRNDLQDVAGVIPPGILANWNSPQKKGQTAVLVKTDFHKDLAMPVVMERWDATLSAIQSVQERYGIRVLVIGFNTEKRPFFEMLLHRSRIQSPTLFIPGQFSNGKKPWCISETDCHPSPWATNIIALGLMDKLVRLGWLPQMDFATDEQQIIQVFRAEEERRVSADELRLLLQNQYARVPTTFVAGEAESRQSVFYGLHAETGKADKTGVIFLRDTKGSSFLELDLETPPNPQAYPRSAVFKVRNPQGDQSRVDVDITSQRMVVRIPLPQGSAVSVYELSWHFDYANCTSPAHCTSGIIHSSRFP